MSVETRVRSSHRSVSCLVHAGVCCHTKARAVLLKEVSGINHRLADGKDDGPLLLFATGPHFWARGLELKNDHPKQTRWGILLLIVQSFDLGHLGSQG